MKNKFPHNEQIEFILKDKANFVKHDGLNFLIPNWKQFANKYADSEECIYEWLNGLDTRKIIDEILVILEDDERKKIEKVLKPIDNLVKEKTFEINECIFGKKVEMKNSFDRYKNWYYYIINQKVFESELGQFTKIKPLNIQIKSLSQ